jgi:hypothetical protein
MNKFLKFSTWQMIIQSRLTAYKNSKTDWCKERRAICRECNNHSKYHKVKTFRQKLLKLLNLGHFCNLCGCSIKYMTVIPQKSCSMESELNEPPKWTRINLNNKYQNAAK